MTCSRMFMAAVVAGSREECVVEAMFRGDLR